MGQTEEKKITLDDARDALERYQWAEASEAFEALGDTVELDGEMLHAWAWSYWLSGNVSKFPGALERTYKFYLDQDQPARAALAALDLVRYHRGRKGGSAQGTGWLKRAERLFEGQEETGEYVYLLVQQAFTQQMMGNYQAAWDIAEGAMVHARKHKNEDAEALLLNRQGRLLIKMGKVKEGQALLDEAMISATSGNVPMGTTGIIYCSTIDGCADVQDWGRAGEWTVAAKAWCSDKNAGGFPGICRIHQAELERLKGDWSQAEEMARRACTELEEHHVHHLASAGHYELGELQLRRGDLDAAAAAFREAEEMGHGVEPGMSRLLLAQGELERAGSGIRRALQETEDKIRRTRLLPTEAEVAVALGDLPRAKAAVDELDTLAELFGSPALLATAHFCRGRTGVLAGKAEFAISCLRKALREWRDLAMPYEAARTRVVLAQAYDAEGDEVGAATEREKAADTFERLGARHELAVLRRGSARESERAQRVFMFTDIVNSTNLLEAMGDAAWTKVLAWHDDTITRCVTTAHGEVVKHTGDGFLLTFDDAKSGIECAVNIQKRFAEHRENSGFAPQVRIGLHEAEATRTEGDYAGMGVHQAARIGSLAGADEVLVSQSTWDASGLSLPTDESREVSLKGIAEPVAVLGVQWK